MPFTKLQMANEQIDEPVFNTRTTINRLYEEKKQEIEIENSELSELPRELVELDVIAEDLMTVDQTAVPIALPSL